MTDIFPEMLYDYTVTQRLVEFNGGNFAHIQPWFEPAVSIGLEILNMLRFAFTITGACFTKGNLRQYMC